MSKRSFDLTVGDWVQFEAVHESHRDNDNNLKKVIKRYELMEPVVGQIVGVKTLVAGTTVPTRGASISTFDYESEPDYGYFTTDQTLYCYQVRLSMRSKPVYVAVADLELTQEHPKRLPWQGRGRFWYKPTHTPWGLPIEH